MRNCFSLIGMALALPAALAAEGVSGELVDFAVEGTIDMLDPALNSDLREGLVLSVFYAYDLASGIPDAAPEPERARYPDAVGDAAVTFDLNHVWVYGAHAGPGDSLVEISRANGPAGQQMDLYSILLPLAGAPIGADGWHPRWLQLWFYLDRGTLPNLSLQLPPDNFVRGWWRISFWNADSSHPVVAEGRITLAGPAGEPLTPSEQAAALRDVVTSLNDRLQTAEERARSLEEEVVAVRRRFTALQATVDRLVEERQTLQQQIAQLELRSPEANAELQERLDVLMAERALWMEKESAWEREQRSLTAALQEVRSDAEQSRRALERLRREESAAESAPTAEVSRPPLAPPTDPSATQRPILIIPTPAAAESRRPVRTPSAPVENVPPVERPESAAGTRFSENLESAEKTESSSRERVRRPGKFNRVGRR